MTTNKNELAFRLFDLPGELRNAIYAFVFEDLNDEKIDIFDVRKCLPPPAILEVSRHIRSETLQLYEEACKAFWSNHTITVACGISCLWHAGYEIDICSALKEKQRLQRCPHIRIHRIVYCYNPSTTNPQHRQLEMDVGIDSTGSPSLACRFVGPDPVSSRESILRGEEMLCDMIERRTAEQGLLKEITTAEGGMHTGWWVSCWRSIFQG